MWETILGGMLQLTVSNLKTKKGKITASELAEAMEKAVEDMKDILRRQGFKVDMDHQSAER
jgi:hypothetical protein